MTSRLEKTTSKPVHLSSKPPSPAQIIATAAASPRNAAETTPKKFEKHARRTWRRSASLRPKNGAPKGFAAGPLPPIVTTTIQVPIPIDIVDMNQATHDDEVKECRSPSTLSTTSSSGVDSNGTTETNETVPHSHPDSGLGDDCPKLSDSDDVESTHSFSSNFGRPPPPQASFFPQPFGLPGFPDILPPIATEEELENIRQFRRQHIYYKNFFARQRRLQQNGPAFIPTHPHPQVPYIFIPYETIDNFLLYLESLYPQLSRSRSTTMQSSDESCCSTTATIQSRAEAAEASMPLRHDPRLEASFAPLRFVPPMNGAAQPVGPCSTTTQSSRKTSIDSTHTSEDGHPLSYVPHMPSYSSMPVLAQQASRNDLDYSRIYLDQFNVNPHFERRHPFAPPHLQQRHRHYQHFPSGIHRTATGESGYLSCESVSPPPSSETTAPTESKAPPTPLPPPNDVFHDGQFQVSKMDVLSEQIWYFHKDITQTEATLHRKMTLRNHLYSVIKMAFPMSGLYIVGSSLNGFGNNSSDMDLCMMITNKDIDQRTDAVVILNHVMNCLSNSEIIRENGLKLIIAKVPILRIKFNAPYEDITVDLNANNAVAIKNTHLLSHYSTFDWRLCPLVSVIKEWAKRRGMNDANKSSFTSYSLVLMVIHYLQCGLDKPTLPSLQKMYPKRFSEKNDVRTLKMQIEKPFEFPSADEWDYDYSASLCDLLLGFLRYYAYEFDFNHDAISVRLGQRTDRAFVAKNSSPFNTLSQWRCICIEEPFTLSNTAHSIYDEVIFEAIKGAFRSGHEELDMNRDLDAFLNMPPIKIPLANTRGQHYGNFAVETNFTPTDPEPPVLVGNENGVESSENDVVDRKLVEDVLDSLKAAEEENFPAISASEDAPQKRSAKKNRKGARGGK